MSTRSWPNIILRKDGEKIKKAPLKEKKLNKEEEAYQKALGQFKLLNWIKRAAIDGDINPSKDYDSLPEERWRFKKEKVLRWVKSNRETIDPLRHFPADTDDVLTKLLRKKIERVLSPTTDKAKKKQLKKYIFKIGERVLKDPMVTAADFRKNSDVDLAIKESGLKNFPATKTFTDWCREIRKKINVKLKVTGRPPKK